jgi:hypothetical protein
MGLQASADVPSDLQRKDFQREQTSVMAREAGGGE